MNDDLKKEDMTIPQADPEKTPGLSEMPPLGKEKAATLREDTLDKLTVAELRDLCSKKEIKITSKTTKAELVELLLNSDPTKIPSTPRNAVPDPSHDVEKYVDTVTLRLPQDVYAEAQRRGVLSNIETAIIDGLRRAWAIRPDQKTTSAFQGLRSLTKVNAGQRAQNMGNLFESLKRANNALAIKLDQKQKSK